MKHRVPVLFFALLIIGCANDSESDLMNPPDDETEFVTYEGTIKSIISNNCLGCHSNPPINGAPFSLTTYSQVKTRAESGLLLTAISRQTGEVRAMPPTGRLPQATIDLVEQWITDGLLEN